MQSTLTRRDFTKTVALGLGAAAAPTLSAQGSRKLKAGHTGITWGFQPADAEQAIKDVASLGYHAYESFGGVIEAWEEKGGLDKILKSVNLPLQSAYCPVNLTDSTRRKDEVAKMVRWGNLIKKCGGTISVIGPNGVKREEYNFNEHRANIIASLNDICTALNDIGVVGVLHQHTGTCVESRDETYSVMEGVNTEYVKFGPDVGQLQKGGSDPVQVVKDFLSVTHHVHMKDFDGGEHYLGYCPLGQGEVDVAALCDLFEKSGNDMMIMVELDPSDGMPLAPLEAARISKTYMQKLGYTFGS